MGGSLLNIVELRERGELYNMLCFYCPRVAVFQKLSSVYTFILLSNLVCTSEPTLSLLPGVYIVECFHFITKDTEHHGYR